MKTDQKMTIRLSLGDIEVFHKSGMGDLSKLFQVGNIYRHNEGKAPMLLTAWIQRQDVKDYIEFLGEGSIARRKGRGGGTYACLKVMLDAAASLSPRLKDEIYTLFIEQRILGLRDLGGDNFIDLNAALALNAEEVLGKPAHRGHYITLAKILKERCEVEDWNLAAPDQLNLRARMEDRLSTMLRAGVVRDWDHLKELAEKV